MKKDGFNIYNSSRFLRESVDYLKYDSVPWKNKYIQCGFPKTLIFITVDGHLYMYGSEEFNSVSLLDPLFPEIFHSKDFADMAAEKVKKCPGCMCSMAETFLLGRDINVFLEKVLIGLKVNYVDAKKLSHDQILKITNAA